MIMTVPRHLQSQSYNLRISKSPQYQSVLPVLPGISTVFGQPRKPHTTRTISRTTREQREDSHMTFQRTHAQGACVAHTMAADPPKSQWE